MKNCLWKTVLCAVIVSVSLAAAHRDKFPTTFGLSSPHFESSALLAPNSNFTLNSPRTVSHGEEVKSRCSKLKLGFRQMKICLRGQGIPEILEEAARTAAMFCRNEFRYERWSCNLDKYHKRLLRKVHRETAVALAFAAASLEHSVSRGCATGKLRDCHCASTNDPLETRQMWKLGGCGDNLSYGRSFTDKFLGIQLLEESRRKTRRNEVFDEEGTLNIKPNLPNDKKESYREDRDKQKWRSSSAKTGLKANVVSERKVSKYRKEKAPISRILIDSHNNRIGQQVVEGLVRRNCKCHGVSGSCSVQTCWDQLLPFDVAARHLKLRYDNAVRVDLSIADNISNLNKDHSKFAQHMAVLQNHRDRLVFMEQSPDFCTRSRLGPGTKDRVCQRGKNCDVLCCGRGYNVYKNIMTTPCQCRLVSCCKLECSKCITQNHIDKCK